MTSISAVRADARRNIDAIVDAAAACLSVDPDASVQQIAAAAGVGRATLYGHFRTRGELVDAAFVRTLEQAEASLAQVDTTADPRVALRALVRSSWRVVSRHRMLLRAAEGELGVERLRAHHQTPMRRVRDLIVRGKELGIFRALPTDWLVAVFYNVLHTAADEVAQGRLQEAVADTTIAETLFAVLVAPDTAERPGSSSVPADIQRGLKA